MLSNTAYFEEVKKWMDSKSHVPSRAMCEKFINRVSTGWAKANRNGYHNDSEDYHAWGWALTNDIHVDGENFKSRELFTWNEFYEQVPKTEMPKIGSKVIVYLYKEKIIQEFEVIGLPEYDDFFNQIKILVGMGGVYPVRWDSEQKRWEFRYF